ncbi:hypothetical protein BKA56DRAFT_673562 [Ilyonectria sp. MPI-CAGE-AT-0026]|nr:hypothetical protein BKA56DRAFT_673562 [Ilyonectria sp. MPI-CAGE-AT-0026]
MPGPPTPVSGCPLQRLEIRDGASTRVYHTCRPRNVFTLTLEGERPVDSKTGTLVLLIHNGQQRLISIRLHDLLKNPVGSTDIVSVEKQRNEMCIIIPGHSRAIVARFEEKRDFSLAVYMLEKSNLRINDSITCAPSTPIATSLPAASLDVQTASNFGPRLSSITPLPQSFPSNVPYNLNNHSDAPFTSLLNSPLPRETSESTWGQPAPPQFQYPQRINSLPTYASVSAYSPFGSDAAVQQLNPYNIFLNRSNSQVHMPRVSSPLRQSFPPEQTTRQSPSPSVGSSPYMGGTYTLHNIPNLSPSVLGAPKIQDASQSAGVDGIENRVPTTSPFPQFSNDNASPEPLAGDSDQNFRDLMPRPRRLPFDSRPKDSGSMETTSSPKLATKPAASLKALVSPKITSSPRTILSPKKGQALTQPSLKQKPKLRGTKRSSAAVDEGTPGGEVSMTVDESPTRAVLPNTKVNEEQKPNSTIKVAGAEDSPSVPLWSPAQPHKDPEVAVLITDPGTLKDLEKLTSKLFEQYEVDMASGIDETDFAKFYMDRITATRREFWLTKLEEMTPS